MVRVHFLCNLYHHFTCFAVFTISRFLTSVPPQINKNDIPGEGLTPKEVKVKVNSTLTLECAAQAFPTPALQWYKDGQVEIFDDSVNILVVLGKHSSTGSLCCLFTIADPAGR